MLGQIRQISAEEGCHSPDLLAELCRRVTNPTSYIDTTNEWGDLIAAFAAKLAELVYKRIKARIKAGLAKARAEGVALGRPRVMVDRGKVWRLKDAGKSIREIAAELGYSHWTVQRAAEARSGAAA